MYPFTSAEATATALVVVLVAALLHASFQLGAIVLSRLSSHTLGARRSHRRLMHLVWSYVFGNLMATALLLLGASYIITASGIMVSVLWALVCAVGISSGLGLLWYNVISSDSRDHWLPVAATSYLYERAGRTKRGLESASLGIMTSVAELPFVAAPLLLTAMILHGQPDLSRLSVIGTYAVLSGLPLLIALVMAGSGVSLSHLERWRDRNKRFITAASGVGLLALSVYAFSLFGLTDTGGGV